MTSMNSSILSVRTTAIAFVLIQAAIGAMAQQPSAERDSSAVGTLVNGMYPQLLAVYEDIHAHPELGFEETRTAAKLATEMRTIGFQVTEKIGKTGVVAIFRNGAGPSVLVRTELDALPMER